ncbi:MAG TPA: cupin domain-containing protein [Reyranellaceae bacterium]|nr:cupin domain-containing protein [Reyranellaceae bacterium]
MFNLTKTTVAAGIIALAALGSATPAMADQHKNPLANAPTMPKDVTDTVIGSIDLGPEINVQGRQLRTRRLVVQPGGVVPVHSHTDRPALIVVVSGSITEHRSDRATPVEHRAGDISREAEGISHYWINHGTEPAVLLSSDVFNGK